MVRRTGTWLAAALAAVSLEIGCSKKEPKPPAVSAPKEVTFVSSDSAHLAGTWQRVANSPTAVICIPTVGFTRSTWSNTARLLTNSGWSVLSFDLRGEGESKNPAGSTWAWSPADSAKAIELYVKDIRAAVRYVGSALGGDAKVILVGADIAGVAALYAATAERAVKGVVLITPPGDLNRLIAGGLVVKYGDRPLLIMTEQPVSATVGTPRTTDSWLGRGSAISMSLSTPQKTMTLNDKQAALNKLRQWIDAATR